MPDPNRPKCCPFCGHAKLRKAQHGYAVEGGGWDQQREESREEFSARGYACQSASCKRFILVPV